MSVTKNRLAGLALAALICGLDQYVKWLMVVPLQLKQVRTIEILPFFDLHWVENYGVSLGMFTADSMESRWLLVAVTALVAAVVLVWLLRERALADIAALGLVLGGAVGNIYDRATKGFVIDYADLHFGTFRPFLVFNIADAAITIGVLIILARTLLSREKPAKTAAEAAPEA